MVTSPAGCRLPDAADSKRRPHLHARHDLLSCHRRPTVPALQRLTSTPDARPSALLPAAPGTRFESHRLFATTSKDIAIGPGSAEPGGGCPPSSCAPPPPPSPSPPVGACPPVRRTPAAPAEPSDLCTNQAQQFVCTAAARQGTRMGVWAEVHMKVKGSRRNATTPAHAVAVGAPAPLRRPGPIPAADLAA